MRVGLLFTTAMSATCLLACSLLVDTSGYIGPSSFSDSEGGPPTQGDGSTPPPPTPGVDGGVGTDSSIPSGCQTGDYCWKFDDDVSDPVLDPFVTRGTITREPDVFISPPRSFVGDTRPNDTEQASAASFFENRNRGPNLHVEYDVMPLIVPTDYTETTMVRAVDGADGVKCEFFLVMNDQWVAKHGCPAAPETELGAIVVNEWKHIVWDIVGEKGTLHFGERIVKFDVANGGLTGTTLKTFFGVYYSKPKANRTRLAMDNLVIR